MKKITPGIRRDVSVGRANSSNAEPVAPAIRTNAPRRSQFDGVIV